MLEDKDKVGEEKEETVTLKKKDVLDLLKRVDRLETAADKHRLANFDEKNKLPELPRVRINAYIDDKTHKEIVVVGWPRLIMDESFVDSFGIYHEKQLCELHLEDGQKIKINYADRLRVMKGQPAEVISKTKNEEEGTVMLKLRRMQDGKEYEIDERFIN